MELANNFIHLLNLQLNENERIFKLGEVSYKREMLNITLLLDAVAFDRFLNNDLEKKVNLITSKITEDINFKINFKKAFTDFDIVKKLFYEYVYTNSLMVFSRLIKQPLEIDTDGSVLTLTLHLEQDLYSIVVSSQLINNVSKYLETQFMESIEIVCIPTKVKNNLISDFSRKKVFSTSSAPINPIRTVGISEIVPLIGEIVKKPRVICEAKEKETKGGVICGVIADFRVIKYSSKDGYFVALSLYDTTAKIKAIFFPRNPKMQELFCTLKDGDHICVEGNIEFDNYSKENSIKISRVVKCVIDFESVKEAPKAFNLAPEKYYYIKPEPYVEVIQTSLIGEDKVYFSLKGEFVVFDLETTGLDEKKEDIIEIAGVKIVDGIIKETFASYVYTPKVISEEITKLTGITNLKTDKAPAIDKVIPDFFKFCENATLVAHNISFDSKFLKAKAAVLNFNFSNNQIDTLALARAKLTLPNYKLITVCNKLGVVNQKAHRAIFDALATAEVFRLLYE